MEEKAEAEEEKAEDLVKRIPPDLSEEVAEDYLKELTNSKYCPKYLLNWRLLRQEYKTAWDDHFL